MRTRQAPQPINGNRARCATGATLDATGQEPLPADHPFWRHPKIVLTPHIAAQTVVDEAIAQFVARVTAMQCEAEFSGQVDLQKGY